MINIYTDKDFLNQKYRRHLFPLLLDLFFLKDKTLLSYFTIVENISDCDIVIFPIDYVSFLKHKGSFKDLLYLARKNNKVIWLYAAGDFGFTSYIENSYIFRLGGFDSKFDTNTYIMPSFVSDPYKEHLNYEFKSIKKQEQPSIGFVGHAQGGLLKYVKEYINYLKYDVKRRSRLLLADKQSFYPSGVKRASYLVKLTNCGLFKTDFIFRNQYRAGAKLDIERNKTAKEFYENIYNNAYTFCLRGVGNFSVRFYETLATGRIPILIDTDCRLPLHEVIDWNKHCVIIKENESMEEQILNFHNKLSNIEFEELQQSNRELWLSSLKRDGYYKLMHQEFIKNE